MAEVTHKTPPTGLGLTPCCSTSPFNLPQNDRLSLNDELVDCPGHKPKDA